ncbi:MAG: hypothetical protein EU552_01575 [Promethearchaeota archaeon]|nr:MAG: hypothetical protein EU552_01575 [Candidatus Lokiarchaeota archaeon]
MDHEVKTPKSGFDTIIEFYNQDLKINHPIAISELVDRTGFSWSFIKKTLKSMVGEYEGFHFEKSGGTWITWKDREHIIKKTDDTCSRFLKDDENNH